MAWNEALAEVTPRQLQGTVEGARRDWQVRGRIGARRAEEQDAEPRALELDREATPSIVLHFHETRDTFNYRPSS